MANKKTNAWMISTFVLAGVIVGTGIGLGISQIGFIKSALSKAYPVEQVAQNQPVDTETVDPKNVEIAPVTAADHMRGAQNPKITFVEYSDTECPFCKKFHTILKQIIAAFPNDVQWVYRHLPLTDLHPKAFREAVALECAAEIGGNDAFWAYLDRLMEVTPGNNGLDPKELNVIANFVKLDGGKFTECLASNRHDAKINAQIQDAAKNGGDATPFSVVIAPDAKKYLIVGQVDFTPLSEAIKKLLQ